MTIPTIFVYEHNLFGFDVYSFTVHNGRKENKRICGYAADGGNTGDDDDDGGDV